MELASPRVGTELDAMAIVLVCQVPGRSGIRMMCDRQPG